MQEEDSGGAGRRGADLVDVEIDSGLLSQKIRRIDEEFLTEACDEKFVDKMFGDESKITRQQFIAKLQTPDFSWMFDMQKTRDKVDEWLG